MIAPIAKPRSVRPKVRAERDPYSDARALFVIDQRRLQGAAWAEYHTAQKRHEKAARDLHRHEEVDTPAFNLWLNQEFPVLLTDLRNTQDEVTNKGRDVRLVRALAAWSGRSAKKLWQEHKENLANPPAPDDGKESADDDEEAQGNRADDPDDDFFSDGKSSRRRSRSGYQDRFDSGNSTPAPPRSTDARDIYRRLVQRLHPDRGGEWSEARKRVWHEVQQAWARGDADWLARLEVEWESANEVLTPTSALSRLRRAIEELHGARRDTESKLRAYRTQPAWRFSLTEKKRDILRERTAARLAADLEFLRRQLAHLDATIRGWEEPTLGRSRPRHTEPGVDEESSTPRRRSSRR